MANLLGIDYGRKNIGLAIARGRLAEPLTTLQNTSQFRSQLKKICQDLNISSIVVGISEGHMAKQTQLFAHNLSQEINLPITFHDETLSSYQAQNQLLHAKRTTRTAPQDAYQAAVMLQDYLDTHQDKLC